MQHVVAATCEWWYMSVESIHHKWLRFACGTSISSSSKMLKYANRTLALQWFSPLMHAKQKAIVHGRYAPLVKYEWALISKWAIWCWCFGSENAARAPGMSPMQMCARFGLWFVCRIMRIHSGDKKYFIFFDGCFVLSSWLLCKLQTLCYANVIDVKLQPYALLPLQQGVESDISCANYLLYRQFL